jgi:hypothetical protein
VAAVAGLPWKHFRAPLGSIVIGTFLVVAEPAFRANETAGEANNAKNAKATVIEVIDMEGAPLGFGRFAMLCCGHSMGAHDPLLFRNREQRRSGDAAGWSRKRSPQSFVAARYDVVTAGRELGYSRSD